MTDDGIARPRRALGPLPDDAEAPLGRRGLRALPFDPDWEPADAETQVLRRVIMSDSPLTPASPASPADTAGRAWAATPVPPPRPVLPTSSAAPASAGRRFSASASPREFEYVPRRSATSVSSPPEVYFRPAGGDPAPASPASPAAPEPAPKAAEPRRSGRRAIAVLAGIAAVVGLVLGGVWWLGPTLTATPKPTQTTSPASLDPLLTPADLGRLGATAWITAVTPPPAGDGNPICLPAEVEEMPTPDRTARRVLTPNATGTDFVTHVVDTYPDEAAATRAYQARLLQAGSCADTEALIVAAYTVDGLADSAFSTRIDVQEETTEPHVLVVSRTGRNLSMIDITTADPTSVDDAVQVATQPLARLCSGGEGTCPTLPTATETIPAAGQLPGWLVEADLPLVTPGAGRWGANAPSSSLTIVGSQCETVVLKKVPDVTAAAQRTLMLADDPQAPTVFGVDQVVYTFATPKAAKSFADQLGDDLADCTSRVPTATVEKGPSVKGEGQGGISFSGESYLITQQTVSGGTATYRVGVLRIADRVSYLLANPSADFDFSKAQWKAILTRTGERVTQLP